MVTQNKQLWESIMEISVGSNDVQSSESSAFFSVLQDEFKVRKIRNSVLVGELWKKKTDIFRSMQQSSEFFEFSVWVSIEGSMFGS